jgi:hypothetical protein
MQRRGHLWLSCHSRLTFVDLLCREPGKRLKEDVPELVGAFEASQDRKQKMPRSRAGQGVLCVPHTFGGGRGEGGSGGWDVVGLKGVTDKVCG